MPDETRVRGTTTSSLSFNDMHDLRAGIGTQLMRWTLLTPALLAAGTCLTTPAHAFWPLDTITGILSAPFSAFHGQRYNRYSSPRRRRVSEGVVGIKPGLLE